MENKQFLTIKEAAAYLGVTTLTLRNWDKAGKLEASRHPLNNYRMYAKIDLDSLINKIEKGEIKKREAPRSKIRVLEVKHFKKEGEENIY